VPEGGCAWITGASSGIGRALALRMARGGWTVGATARRAEALETLAAEAKGLSGRIVPVPCDVTDREAVARALADLERETGPVHLAVLNAGIYEPDQAETLDPEAFARTVDLNLTGTVGCIATLMPGWIERRRGHLVVVSSVAGYSGLPRSLSYGATKAALINFCEGLKFDFDRLGLAVQVVCPGFVRTPATDRNDFKMPALMEVEDAAEAIYRGLDPRRFEITFPKRFTYVLKFLRCLPHPLYFRIVGRITGR